MATGWEVAKTLSMLPIVYHKLQKIACLDELPSYIKKDHYIIFNKNHHWICLFRSKHFNCIEGFDSLGFNYNWYKKNIPYKQKIVFNTKVYQSLDTNSCALFCIHFISFRIMNLDISFNECLNLLFTENIPRNELRVKNEHDRISRGEYLPAIAETQSH